MVVSSIQTNNLDAVEITEVVRRLCDHLGIAFVANRLLPSLAEISDRSDWENDCQQLNLLGQNFGMRFRELVGNVHDLAITIQNTGPVVVSFADSDVSVFDDMALILMDKSSDRFVYLRGDQEFTVNKKGLCKLLNLNGSDEFNFYLAQPLLAAESASRFHYSTGEPGEAVKPMKRFLAMLKPDSKDIRSIFIFSVIVGLLGLTTPLAVEAVVNTIAFGRYLQPLVVLSLIVLTFLGFMAGLNVLMSIITEIMQRKLFVRTVEDLSYRLTRVPITTWRQYHGPELVNRFFDIVNVQKITAKLFLDTLMLALQTVIGLSVLAFYHPFLLGYDIALLMMMSAVLWFLGRGAIKTAMQESQMKYETAAWLQEIVRHPSTFKYNGGLGYAINRADNLASQYVQIRQNHFKILLGQISFAMIMQVVAATVLLALGGYLVIVGQMTLGQLVAAELIVTVILGSFTKIGKDLESFYDLMASVDKLGKLFDLPVESFDRLQLARRPGAYGLSMVKVKIDVTDEKEHSIEINAGQSYAIYSANELRRGQLIDGMVGHAKPESGHFLLDNFRVDALSAESLQQKISVVKEIELFDGTIEDNVRLGRGKIGSYQMNETIHQMGLRETISALPNGYQSALCISGYPLSQGQAIRLVLARSLVASPAVLFIDGLLDRLSDDDTQDVLQRLSQFTGEVTIIISTGRKAIAVWAGHCLNIDSKHWRLGKFDG